MRRQTVERKDLGSEHATDTILEIRPPNDVANSRPKNGSSRPRSLSGMEVREEGKTPSLWRVVSLRIKLVVMIRHTRHGESRPFRGHASSIVGKVRDLIFEHFCRQWFSREWVNIYIYTSNLPRTVSFFKSCAFVL